MIIHRTVHSAGIQDRHGAPDLLEPVASKCPRLACLVADAAYRGEGTAAAITARGPWRLEIVRRADNAPFEVLPKRWIVERTFAWLSRCRRLAKDFECLVQIAVAFIDLAMIRIMLRRLARATT